MMRSRQMNYAHSERRKFDSTRARRHTAPATPGSGRSLTSWPKRRVSPAYLSEVEPLKDVSMERLLAIAKALEIQVADLLPRPRAIARESGGDVAAAQLA